MNTPVPPSPFDACDRRSFLQHSSRWALAASAVTLAPPFLRRAGAQTETFPDFRGELVVVSQSGASPDRALPKILDAFKAAHPNVAPKTILYPEEKFVALYTAAQAAGQTIDVLMLNGQDIRRYAVGGALTPMDDVPFKDRFLPEMLQPFTLDGHLWGLPSGAAGGFLIFANRALLEKHGVEMPSDYAGLKKAAETLRQAGVSAFTHPGKVVYMWPVWFFTTFAQTSGNRSIERTTDILSGRGKFTDADVVEGLDLVFRFGRDKMFSPSVFGLDFPNAQTEFQTGKAAFYLFHDSIAKPLLEANPPDFQLDCALMPDLTGKGARAQFPGGPGVAVSIPAKLDAKRKAAALALADFLTTDASSQQSLELNGGAVPVNANVNTAPIAVYQKEKEVIGSMVTYLDWFYPPEITKTLQEGLQAGLAGRTTADRLGKDLQGQLDRLYAGGYKFAG